MKIKQVPEDFIVEEIPLYVPKSKGSYAIYKLEKTNMDLIAAKKTVVKKLNVSIKNISHAGIKDKIARTSQHISIKTDRGSRGNFKLTNISLEHIGYLDRPLKSGDLIGNKFTITIRDLTDKDLLKIKNNLKKVKEFGIPNYFDSQRFGEDLTTGGFIAKRLMKEDYENALRLYLASQNNLSIDKNEVHGFIHKNWGKWAKIREYVYQFDKLNEEKKIIDYLCENPNNYARAFKIIGAQKKELLVSAYQSFIWNKCLGLLLKKRIKNIKELDYEAGRLFFYESLTNDELDYLKSIELPMIDARTKIIDKKIKEIVDKVLEKEKIKPSEFKIKKMTNLFFKERKRDVIVFPKALEIQHEGGDELNKGQKKIQISFSLNKGAYATLLLKVLNLI